MSLETSDHWLQAAIANALEVRFDSFMRAKHKFWKSHDTNGKWRVPTSITKDAVYVNTDTTSRFKDGELIVEWYAFGANTPNLEERVTYTPREALRLFLANE